MGGQLGDIATTARATQYAKVAANSPLEKFMIKELAHSFAALRRGGAALALILPMLASPAPAETPKDTLILSGGVDVTYLNPFDTFAILPPFCRSREEKSRSD